MGQRVVHRCERSGAEQFHGGELNHHLQPGTTLSGQPSIRCEFRGALPNPLIFITLPALTWCLLFNIRAFLWIEIRPYPKIHP